ncbi:MAG: hypothetical protein ACD_79C01060G0001 [uncultured bacterium]|nr:MAG: hypothetical protein ACD_79C01060G0001 [uncultured bacterium]
MKKSDFFLFSALAVLFLLFFSPIYKPLYYRFTAFNSYYSHGFLVPFISIYLAWRKRDILKTIPVIENKIGLYIIICGIILFTGSRLFVLNIVSYIAFFAVIFGMILYLFGTRIVKEVSGALIFLLFMLPLPEFMIIGITFKMKMFATYISNIILNQIGLKTEIAGSRMFYPGGSLIVGDVCSGLRSSISFLALSAILVQIVDFKIWKKILIVFSSIPIAIISNVSRITLLVIACYIYGEHTANGIIHDLLGILVFIVGFILFMILIGMMKCKDSKEDLL